MQRKTGHIKCWNCNRWITKQGILCPFCGKNKEQSRQVVEAREDRFIALSFKWLITSLLFAAVLWVIYGPVALFLAGLLLFLPGLVVSYFWTGLAGG
jgi:ACR3 family arsenite efflux pump ArsB